MGRTRTIATDQTTFEDTGIEWEPGFRAVYSSIDSGFDGVGNPGLGQYNEIYDYVPVTLPFSVQAGSSYSDMNIWGLGFVSFGQVSIAEQHFVMALNESTNFSYYPGRVYILSSGPSRADTFRIDVGIRDFNPTVVVDPFGFGESTLVYSRANAIPVSYVNWDGRAIILSESGLYASNTNFDAFFNETPQNGPPVAAVTGSAGSDVVTAGQSASGDYNAETIVKPQSQFTEIGLAISLDGFFDFQSDPFVTGATLVPHASVRAGYSGLAEVYAFTVPQNGGLATFDIDETRGIDTVLRLLDSAGNVIAGGPLQPGWDDAGALDPGSSNSLDSFKEYSFAVGGQYFLEVTAYAGSFAPDAAYTLHVSLPRARLTRDFGFQGGVVDAGAGNDTLISGRGGDRLDGNLGVDVASYSTALRGVTADLSLGAVQGDGQDLLIGIENLTGSVFADLLRGDTNTNVLRGGSGDDSLFGLGGSDVLLGGPGNDLLDGGDGTDTLAGEAGNDVLQGGAGPNELVGGPGNDLYVIVNGTDSTVEIAGDGVDEVQTILSVYELQSNVENLRFTDTGSHQAGVGNSLDNIIIGNSGRDSLFGRAGNDTLIDGGGAVGNEDTLLGGAGDDIYVIGLRGTSTIENVNDGLDEVRTTFSIYSLQANIENLTLTDNGAHQAAVGNGLANTIRGGTGRDEIFGRAGDDTIYGGAGAANLLTGDEGDDIYVVEAVGDSVFERLGEGGDTVRTSLPAFTLPANVEQLTYFGSSAFTGIGNASGNVIRGAGGDDSLSGIDGDDVLVGGSGADLLIGGAGADQFLYQGGETGYDRVLDFAPGTDKLVLSSGGFTRTATLAFVNGTAATSANSTFLYNPGNGIVSYDSDGTGSAAPVVLAQLNTGLVLSLSDFSFVNGSGQTLLPHQVEVAAEQSLLDDPLAFSGYWHFA